MNSKNGNIKIANNLILSHMGKDGTNLYGKIQLFFSYFQTKDTNMDTICSSLLF